jgi:hypothetical protein
MYEHLSGGFEQSEQLAHPVLEDRSRTLAAYVLSATGEPVNSPREIEGSLRLQSGKPLAESVSLLRKLAYEEGLEQQPLIDKMREKIMAEGLDPQSIADKLEKVNRQVKTKRRYSDVFLWNIGESNDWFLRETFCRVSTLDNEGKYVELDAISSTLKVVKSWESAQSIIESLRSMSAVGEK